MGYTLVPQKRYDYCACSVLQAIIGTNGISISQEEIARRLTPGEKGGFYFDDDSVRILMKEHGFYYRYFNHNETPFNEPDFLLSQMSDHHGLVAMRRHVRLLQSFDDPKLTMIDPDGGSLTIMDLREVRGSMASSGGGFGLAKKL